jgi:3-hydroxy-9,10-secoandrosta-1,3,5(10)-triene-9,17-dione monooxygenase
VIADSREAIERVEALLPAFRARAAGTEAERRISDETIAELREQGLFGIATPKAFGGSELGFAALVEVSFRLASACGSTGWVFGVLTGHNWMVSLLPQNAQDEVFGDPRALTASVFRMGGKVVPADGGFRLTGGEGKFCSGIDFADWVVVGNAVQRADAPPEPRFFLIPKSSVEIVDDWFTTGMRGTGSRSIRVADAFIPEHRSMLVADMARGTTPGALLHARSPGYSVPFPIAQPFSLIGNPLGMAKGALDAFAQSVAKKLAGYAPEQVGEQGASFARLSRAAAEIDAARALVLGDAAFLDRTTEPSKLSALDRTRIQRDFAYAAQQCRYAVTSLFEASGGTGIYDGSVVQRFWRDCNSASAHTAFNWDDASGGFARALLGLPPSRFAGPRR